MSATSATTLPGTTPAPPAGATAPGPGNNLTGFTVTHDLIRRVIPELGRRLAGAAAAGSLDTAAVERLTIWWHMFTAILEGHHTSEDSHVWPVVLDTEPGLAGVARTLEEQHESLDGHLAGIDDGLRGLAAGQTEREVVLTGLLARIAEFDALMHDHLALEERTMVPVLREKVPAEAYRAMLASLASGHDPMDFVPTMPLLLEKAAPEAREFMLGGMPPALRARYEAEFEPAYRALAASLPAA
ncbi:hemerythrin-like domain-containing protein [Streptomyces sp. V4I23]|uniref:hemerythrin domain-containing protein n=1 Tax=Streptomyces sp. V4I23 TaxID=3042282 RepID=UPI00278006EB|nr:hemerythrin domain-containing protein [Streptomyces sp. V4I23]MDQ1008551.1 hemerythrin-like domain-containing protein [Streptomyces sp. V4I23]